MPRRRLAAALILMPLGLAASASAQVPTVEGVEFFEKEIRPILAGRCLKCHGDDPTKLRGGLRLDSRAAILEGGDQGPAAEPGDPAASLLIQAIRSEDPLLRMPPDGPLAGREVAAFEEWVRLGLPDPRTGADRPAPAPAAVEEAARSWWSFQPVGDPEPPQVRDPAWTRDPIDRYVLAKLEAAGLAPAPEADRRTLVRRLTFDLTGMPPTPGAVADFESDDRPDAYERLVDRLLASPHHGERWGRHWLDLVRYADTSGCNGDFPAPEAYRYRNYVLNAHNADKPYDRFLREQVAGDLLPADSEERRREQVIATGYLAISRRFSSVAEEFHLTLDDAVDNLGKAVLGLSVSCARCHDHKFDPIPQADYYALYGIFASTRFSFPGTEIYRHPQNLVPLVPEADLAKVRPILDRMAELDREIFDTYSTLAELDTGEEKEKLRGHWQAMAKERDELTKKLPRLDFAYAAAEGDPADTPLQIKGDPKNLGPPVPRGFLQVLGGEAVPPDEPRSGRRQLAAWLTDAENPLTARVMANRIWQHHFGKGLVRTPNDFGTRGEPPTHPELLDHLARSFVDSGWSLKALHRRIVLSSAYRMACIEDSGASRLDPEDKLLWNFPRRRLSAEEIRDAILAISGELDRSPGGPHPFPPAWEWRYTQHNPFVADYPTSRRSVYLMQQRIRLQPFLAVFDGADTNAPTDGRKVSTTPQQALFLLNDEFAHAQAARLADRLAAEAAGPAARVDRAYRLALARPASDGEAAEAFEYLARVRPRLREAGLDADAAERAAWASFLRVLFSGNEFVFVD